MDKHKEWLMLKYVPIIVISLICYKLINQYEIVVSFFEQLKKVFTPIIWGGVIAYLLNPIMMFFERKFKLNRIFSMLVVYILFVLVLVGLVMGLVPNIIEGSNDMLRTFPSKEELSEMYYGFLERIDLNFEGLSDGSLEESFNINELLSTFSKTLQENIAKLGTMIYSFAFGILNFIIGVAISLYILWDKEQFSNRIVRILRAFFGEEKAADIIEFFKEVDLTFGKFIVGKSIDSLIIGILCFIGLTVLNVRFALILSIIVGITNMIPYFGPFIGAVPAVIVTMFYSPILAIWVALFILLLQQLDGYVIGPAILGDSLGVSAFWIIFAVLVGGGFFGVLGMLLGVPVVALIRNLINKKTDEILSERSEVLSERIEVLPSEAKE